MSKYRKLEDLSEQLLKRFKDVPNIELEDAKNWVELAMNEHGYQADDGVPTKIVPLVMLYAEADGASQVALRTAYYFSFVDKDESVDKSMIPDQYRKLSDKLWERYKRKKEQIDVDGVGGARFKVLHRIDRP